ncbi:MAG: hypothetical protein AMS16_03550, partial [Planctomycetes bacterium DG_58]
MWAVGAICLLAAWLTPGGATAAAPKTTTCAVVADPAIDLDKSLLVPLLEDRLARRGDLRLINRTEIRRVLAERKLA